MSKTDNKLGLFALIAMCVGSMIGSGLFDLPQNAAVTSGVGALLIGWTITFVGMMFLVKVFQNLSMRRPDLDAGVYAYAKEGLGDYLGFCSAWGYWLSAWVANIAYLIIFCSALSLFFPVFGNGNNLPSLILNSLIMWSVTYLCVWGVSLAAVVNTIATVAKIVPIAIFIAIVALAFNKQIFMTDIWQVSTLGPVTDQIKNVMLVMVWVFIGIEGASVFSARAKNRKDIGRATIISFFLVFFMFLIVSVLPFGIMGQEQLAGLTQKPAIGAILNHVVGDWGAVFINIGLVIAVLSAFLTWTMIAAEVPYIAGKKDALFPKIFIRENVKRSPVGSLIVTGLCQQVYLVVALYYNSGYLATVLLAASLILLPYLSTALYALILAVSGKTYERTPGERNKDFIFSLLAVVYGIWLIYAAGIKYLLLTSILYCVGNIIFIITKKKNKQKIFNGYEFILFLIISLLGAACVFALATGKVTI